MDPPPPPLLLNSDGFLFLIGPIITGGCSWEILSWVDVQNFSLSILAVIGCDDIG